jgi:phosphoribosylamine--glycine ligase
MKILLIGSGGREHALAWKMAQSPSVQKVYVAPGNGGTALAKNKIDGIENIALSDLQDLADFAKREKIHLTVVGPEAPLAQGIVDVFRNQGLRIFGPSQLAAQLESSKDFAKSFMKRHQIPTAEYRTFSNALEAHEYIELKGAPIVIKADGLAAGKGVVVAMNLTEAHASVEMMLSDNQLGDAGARVVIEEFLEGEEASFIVLVDGKHVLALATSQDHKRLLDGDLGPNTGGMGAYSPAPVVSPEIHAKVLREIIMPTVQGMATDGIPYTGFLYAGLMIHPSGQVKTLEFNCRMGDPETQPIMARLKSDLVFALNQAVDGKLNEVELEWDRRIALGVVIASANYPNTPKLGDVIHGLPSSVVSDDGEQMVFHAGTQLIDGKIVTSGGRVLCVIGLSGTLRGAQQKAYDLIQQIQFNGMQYRNDIGHRALK